MATHRHDDEYLEVDRGALRTGMSIVFGCGFLSGLATTAILTIIFF